MSPEQLQDFRERLERAAGILAELASDRQSDIFDGVRLTGKSEGVQLALSYLAEYQREASTNHEEGKP